MAPAEVNGHGSHHALSGFYEETNTGYTVLEEPLGTPRHLRVVVVGAGASGLNTARHMELHMKNYELTIYDKNADVGGTWFENNYSSSQEILQYFKDIAEKYELYKHVQLNHFVQEASWDEDQGIWNIKVKDVLTGATKEDWAHVFINGCGILNNWKWPDIPGLHSFKGALIHSAAWDDGYDFRGKNVAVLGCGSSGIQIVPTIQPAVRSLTTFIRTPTWITAGFAQDHAGPGGANFAFSEQQKKEFREDPKKYMQYRKSIESELNRRFKIAIMGSPEQEEARLYSINEMRTRLHYNERLAKALIPTFGVACRRPTPGNGYLEALMAPNTRVITDRIESVVPEGIKLATGEIVKVDAFICATGFDISFCPRFKLTGRNGTILSEQWSQKPEAYLSMATNNFPNYFMFLGPNSPVAHGSNLPIIEHTTKYLINLMKKMQTQNIKSVSPKVEAIRDFGVHTTEFMKRTVWATPCRSWFKNGTVDGPIIALHPGGRIHWFHMLKHMRLEDWEYTYHTDNRFQFLGNGFSTMEEPGEDNAWYFEDPEEGYNDY
ncbi:putative sterigmatocystin biosynthesis monooxygenase stcW [Fonsecaea pedrosoi]|nr:putative sterigmatocystin biosynthesis monooxygenase stcW [Fonsecaea pedrosoi]